MADQNLEAARRIVEANLSPRARYMGTLEAYVEGTQYDGRPDWFSTTTPLWERAPCIVYPIVRSAIDSNVDLLLGSGRFPAITSRPDEASDVLGDTPLDAETSGTLDKFLQALCKRTRFRSACMDVFASAQGCGSGVAIFGVRGGSQFIDTTRARWCVPELAADGSVLSLAIEYPYVDRQRLDDGSWMSRAMLFRRVIDATHDTTYLAAVADASGRSPNWQPDPERTIAHGLGFCPVVWYPFLRGSRIVGDIDGHAIHEHVLDEVRAHDFALSMRHRAALYCGDPQWTETGVEIGYNPTGKGGRVGVMPTTARGGSSTSENPVNGNIIIPGGRSESVRRKGPGETWQYENPGARVTLHTLPGDALKALDEHASDLRRKLAESLGVVFLDADTLKSAGRLSGRALEMLRLRQLDRCDVYREDFGEGFMLPAVNMMLHIAHALPGTGGGGGSKFRQILSKFGSDDVATS